MHRPVQPPTCAACGYDLTGLPVVGRELRCPECGGNRVRLFRWHEPKVRWRESLLYLPGSAVAALPGLAAGWLILRGTPEQSLWVPVGLTPYAVLGVSLTLWRPGWHAGVTVLGLASALAWLLGLLLAIAMRLPAQASMVMAAPLGLFYLVLPAPFGLLCGRALLGDE